MTASRLTATAQMYSTSHVGVPVFGAAKKGNPGSISLHLNVSAAIVNNGEKIGKQFAPRTKQHIDLHRQDSLIGLREPSLASPSFASAVVAVDTLSLVIKNVVS